jgi:multidrug efflux pump subunit AcrA (membrane-fusion protein)
LSRRRIRSRIAKSDTQGGLSNRVNVQEAKEFKVTIELNVSDEEKSKLRPGMSATATITTKTKNNVIAVPLQAIVEKAPPTPAPGPTVASSAPPAPGEKPKEIKGVYVLDKAGKVKFVEVTTGITGESRHRGYIRPLGRQRSGHWSQSRVEDTEGWNSCQEADAQNLTPTQTPEAN